MADTADGIILAQVRPGQELPTLVQEVSPTTVVLGALATRDWRPMHHDSRFAVERQGVRDIFLNTPNQAAWFERFLTDWTGPKGRLGRMRFRMADPVFAGDMMVLSGTVRSAQVDALGCGWVTVEMAMRVGERLCTTCEARIAVPVGPDDNPWERRAGRWVP